MRKLYLGSIALIIFSMSVIIFQLSCSEDAISQNEIPAATKTTIGGIIVGSGLAITSDGTLSVSEEVRGLTQKNLILYVKNLDKEDDTNEYWLANIDGSNQHKVDITLLPTITLRSEAKLSPDGSKIIFSAGDSSSDHDDIYSVSVSGGTPLKIIDGNEDGRMYINGVY